MSAAKITISGKTRLAQECAKLDPAEEQALADEGLAAEVSPDPDMLNDYDFRGGRRGVYAERYAQDTNLVALAPDVAAVFPDSEAVNEALRTLVRAARRRITMC